LPKLSKYGGTRATRPVISRMESHSVIVGTDTPSGAASSVLFRIWPLRVARSPRKRRKVARSADRAHRADVPLEVGLYVRAEPEPSRRRARDRLREAAPEERDPRRLLGGQGQQLQDRGAPGQRLADPAHQGGLLRSRQEPLARPPRSRVDEGANVAQQLRGVLDLVEVVFPERRGPVRMTAGKRRAAARSTGSIRRATWRM
jgi:hypothetical protein